MELTATFDLGTTALKCVVLDEQSRIVFSGKEELTTFNENGFIEQDANQWWEAFCKLTNEFDASRVSAIVLSGQMQVFLLLDDNGYPVDRVSLYSDAKGQDYVNKLPKALPSLTSIALNGTIPVTKFFWYREHKPEVYKAASHVLFGAKDYIILRLTGAYVSDVTNMSTTGMMNIKTLEYISTKGICDGLKLPVIMTSEKVAGTVLKAASAATGFPISARVFVGTGDAGATTLASGVSSLGEMSINLGTTGWIATVSGQPYDQAFNLAAVPQNSYINVIPIFNGASVHNWVSRLIFPGDKERYAKLHDILCNDQFKNDQLLCLPYLIGERFPVADSEIRGGFYGMTVDTCNADLARSALEGVAFSLRQGLELMKIAPKAISIVGGGAAESVWCQIISDVFDTPVTVFEDSEILPSMALSAIVKFGEGKISSYNDFVKEILQSQVYTVYSPKTEKVSHYNQLYIKFKKLYPSLSQI